MVPTFDTKSLEMLLHQSSDNQMHPTAEAQPSMPLTLLDSARTCQVPYHQTTIHHVVSHNKPIWTKADEVSSIHQPEDKMTWERLIFFSFPKAPWKPPAPTQTQPNLFSKLSFLSTFPPKRLRDSPAHFFPSFLSLPRFRHEPRDNPAHFPAFLSFHLSATTTQRQPSPFFIISFPSTFPRPQLRYSLTHFPTFLSFPCFRHDPRDSPAHSPTFLSFPPFPYHDSETAQPIFHHFFPFHLSATPTQVQPNPFSNLSFLSAFPP